MEESISLEIDGAPVVFTVARSGGGRTYQLAANGVVLATPSRESLSHYGRSQLVDLFREAVRRQPRLVTPAPPTESRIVVVSKCRAYLFMGAGEGDPGQRVMLYRLGADWMCDLCKEGGCEHVELLLAQERRQAG